MGLYLYLSLAIKNLTFLLLKLKIYKKKILKKKKKKKKKTLGAYKESVHSWIQYKSFLCKLSYYQVDSL